MAGQVNHLSRLNADNVILHEKLNVVSMGLDVIERNLRRVENKISPHTAEMMDNIKTLIQNDIDLVRQVTDINNRERDLISKMDILLEDARRRFLLYPVVPTPNRRKRKHPKHNIIVSDSAEDVTELTQQQFEGLSHQAKMIRLLNSVDLPRIERKLQPEVKEEEASPPAAQ
jgi:sulfatase maturation enzyme AslB (radical SAM superfamily)